MKKLEKDIEEMGELGTNKGIMLQKKLDEQLMLRREDKIELQKAKFEITRLTNHMQE